MPLPGSRLGIRGLAGKRQAVRASQAAQDGSRALPIRHGGFVRRRVRARRAGEKLSVPTFDSNKWRVWHTDCAGLLVALALSTFLYAFGVHPILERHQEQAERTRELQTEMG